jgi:hypothetical protein
MAHLHLQGVASFAPPPCGMVWDALWDAVDRDFPVVIASLCFDGVNRPGEVIGSRLASDVWSTLHFVH